MQPLYDLCIVGGGAAGGLIAYEASNNNLLTCLIEKGQSYLDRELPPDIDLQRSLLYEENAMQFNSNKNIAILQGKGLGGSTLVNASICNRMTLHTHEKWVNDFGFPLSFSEMNKLYEYVEKKICVTQVKKSELSQNCHNFIKCLQTASQSFNSISRNVHDCSIDDYCSRGLLCPSKAKQDSNLAFISKADNQYLTVLTETEALKLKKSHNPGLVLVVKDKTNKKQIIKAKAYIICAGTIQTPLLLLRSDYGKKNQNIGKHLQLQPNMHIYGEFSSSNYSKNRKSKKLSFGVESGHYLDDSSRRYKIDSVFPDHAIFSQEIGSCGEEHLRRINNINNFAVMNIMSNDKTSGRVKGSYFGKKIIYKINDAVLDQLIDQIRLSAEIMFDGGAKVVYIPTIKETILTKKEDIAKMISKNVIKNNIILYSLHPTSTCRMSSTMKTGVVDLNGRLWNCEYPVYVADASILPTSIGFSNQTTVYAMAKFIFNNLIKSL